MTIAEQQGYWDRVNGIDNRLRWVLALVQPPDRQRFPLLSARDLAEARRLADFAARVDATLRSIVNLVCYLEMLVERGDARDLPLVSRVVEKPLYSLSAGPRPQYGTPASETVPLSEEQRINTGHPIPLERTERADSAPAVVRSYDGNGALG